MKIRLGVGIPTYNRYDLLEQYLRKYRSDFPSSHIYIVDNGNQNIILQDNLFVIKNDRNLGVGASWNQLCKKIFENYEYALILNDDIYLGRVYEQIISLADKKKAQFIRATPDWCVFLIHRDTYKKVGSFDECFYPAYYEDKSYEYRMRLAGVPILKHPDLNPIVYQSSKTLEKEPKILEQAKRNKRLYIQMWGGEPGKEKLKKPNNEKITETNL